MVIFSRFLLFLGFALLASCGNSDSEAAAPEAAPNQGFKEKGGGFLDNDSTKMLGRYGATNPMYSKKDGQAIPGENGSRQNQEFTGAYGKQEFSSKRYDKKAFWGKKDYAKTVYSGNTDGSRFQTRSREAGKGAQENVLNSSDSGRRFATNEHTTGAARETSTTGIQAVSDTDTDNRRRAYKQPKVVGWKNQHGLQIDDTKDMLGR